MRYIDLFAGVGGFHYGIEKAMDRLGLSRNTQGKVPGENEKYMPDFSIKNGNGREQHTLHCVYSNEWDKYANSVYKKHYQQCDDRDIREVQSSEIPDFDILCGWFPCQAFSIAGKRGGFDDTRGTLFFEIARIAKEKRPRILLLENVKGLLNHEQGRTFATILATLDEIGYDVQWQVLNSKNFGVPQNRERVYIVGHLRGTSRPEIFPITGTNGKDIIVSGVLDAETWRKRHEQIRRVHGVEGISPTLPTGTGGGVMTKIAIPVLTPDRAEKPQNGRRFKTDGEPSFTLTSQDKHGVFDGVKIRRLTPIECERLQGFPDNWTEFGTLNSAETRISDSQRYKMMGNAVTTNVITAIFERLLCMLDM